MTRTVRSRVWLRGLLISLVLIGFSASPSRAADSTTGVLARLAYGLISAGAKPTDAVDVAVNLPLCTALPTFDQVQACMKPFLDKVRLS